MSKKTRKKVTVTFKDLARKTRTYINVINTLTYAGNFFGITQENGNWVKVSISEILSIVVQNQEEN